MSGCKENTNSRKKKETKKPPTITLLVPAKSKGRSRSARYYDSELGRWLSVDPLADKYPGWSPYNYCLNNPLIITDPSGMDTLYFDNTGKYLAEQTKKGDGDHIGYYTDKNGNSIQFTFNDQSDAASILSSTTDNWLVNADGFKLAGIKIGDNDIGELFVNINSMLGESTPISYPLFQSPPEGLMDYVNKITKLDPSINSNATVIDGVAYNNFDLGNYYWGKNMGRIGYTPGLAKFAAQLYERLWNGRTDHPTDQRAIENGTKKGLQTR
jgi:hypothetical protein